ncbi:Uncharacterized protein NEOC95_001884 [Neochlamydia sp. AcF95]|nr:Uncharacterized protein [Neochlamydia sp. AcF95]
MKHYTLLFSLLALMGTTSIISAQEIENNRLSQEGRLNERDFNALQEYISTKRNVDLAEKANNLKVSGDVRSEWRHVNEKGVLPKTEGGKSVFSQAHYVSDGDYKKLRGGNATDPYTVKEEVTPRGLPLSRNDFNVEFNVFFKYEYDRAYAVAHLQYDNACGVSDNGWLDFSQDPAGYHGSGAGKDFSLKRAYWGYNIYEGGGTRFDIEVGRRKLYDVFESEVQFGSRMDGIALYYSGSTETIGEWYWTVAGFVVDERVNHLAYATEIGLMNIKDYGLDVQYSFINWNKYGRNRFFVRNPNGFRFKTSQLTLTYHLNPDWFWGKPTQIFGAVLYNGEGRHRSGAYEGRRDELNPTQWYVHHHQNHHHRSDNRQKWGWYLGFLIGQVEKEGDWSFEAQYQCVQAYAMPDNDNNGIGRGNILEESITYQGRGNTNYKGWKFEGLYALTDNLSLDVKLELTRAAKKSIGGKHHYSNFVAEAIYSF